MTSCRWPVAHSGFVVRVCAALLLVVETGGAMAQTPVAAGNPSHGKAVAAATCAACHGADGNGAAPQYPKLAGQDPAYLYWQLWAFKTGGRRSDVMAGIVAVLSDADLADAASFYAQQIIRRDPVKNKTLASLGERLYLSGTGMTPACAMCHGFGAQRGMGSMMGMMGPGMMGGGMMGFGMARGAPHLNGQHASYIVDQLTRFASGERQGTVMNRIAAALSEADREAVAEFLAGFR